MSRDEVEMLLGIGDNQYRNRGSQQYEDLELRLQIERGVLNPMEYFEPIAEPPSMYAAKKVSDQSEKVTIVLDPNKGIYSLDKNSTNTMWITKKNKH